MLFDLTITVLVYFILLITSTIIFYNVLPFDLNTCVMLGGFTGLLYVCYAVIE